MSIQLSLNFDITKRKHKGNKNSKNAHAAIKKHKQSISKQIFELLMWSLEGLTYEEICLQLDIKPQTASARLADLKKAEKISEVGTRKLSSGVSAAVYKTTFK